jgi:hypothetical protein
MIRVNIRRKTTRDKWNGMVMEMMVSVAQLREGGESVVTMLKLLCLF